MEENIRSSIIEIIKNSDKDYSKSFYYNTGLENLKALENSIDQYSLEDALKCLKDKAKDKETNELGKKEKKKSNYENFQGNYAKLSNNINKFVVYCDVNAKERDSENNTYYKQEEGKRAIARAFIRQNAWAINIIQYLINIKTNQKDVYKDVAFGIKRAIQYFKDPDKQFNILSENHINNIEKYYLKDFPKTDSNDEQEDNRTFDQKLLDYFKTTLKIKEVEKDYFVIQDDTTKIHKYNFTDICVQKIYNDRVKWSSEVETKQLENNYNLILNGAPGTGKTYLAKEIAKKITGEHGENQIGFVQFHPSYDYSDFVEGLRPNNKNGFDLKPGIFKKFCEKALQDCILDNEGNLTKDSKKYVFIIDEINRGEISKIFGELFFSIDPEYRGKKGEVYTQYANMQSSPNAFDIKLGHEKDGDYGHFFVPENVYIIGTMNDIDRSVESMDFAFRRRFSFKEITAGESAERILIYNIEESKVGKAIAKMENVNKKLKELGLPDCYHIGASYFAKIKNYKGRGKWNDLWNYHLRGVIFEYFRGEPDADKNMKALEDAYNKLES